MGIVLLECLIGRPWTEPRSAAAMRKIVDEGVCVSPLDQFDVPVALKQLVERAVASEPQARFSTAKEMADALENYLSLEGEFVSAAQLSAFLTPLKVFDVLKTDLR